MPAYHIYLISSLPMLQFGARPPFSFEQFLEICQDKIPNKEIEIIRSAKSVTSGDSCCMKQPVLEQWCFFDLALRNELVKIRAGRKKIEASKYLRQDGFSQPWIFHIAMAAHRSVNILEGEKVLDLARWNMLDELCAGHFFDLDFLIAYSLKLLILERWDKINSADKTTILAKAIGNN